MKSANLPSHYEEQGYVLQQVSLPNDSIKLTLHHPFTANQATIFGYINRNACLLTDYERLEDDDDGTTLKVLLDVWKEWAKEGGIPFLEINRCFPQVLLPMKDIIDHPVNTQSYLLASGSYTFSDVLSLYQTVHRVIIDLQEIEPSFTLSSQLNTHTPYRRGEVFIPFTEFLFEGNVFEEELDFQFTLRNPHIVELICHRTALKQSFPMSETKEIIREFLLSQYRKHRLNTLFT